MKVYISGISGTGMGPLALFAHDAGIEVCGSDLDEGAIYGELEQEFDIDFRIGPNAQDGEYLKKKIAEGVTWFVHTSALPEDSPEMQVARAAGIKISKRDELINYLVDELDLKIIAVAGTHGKTTTTAMLVWASIELGLPVAYMVGTTLEFAPSGAYHPGDRYLVYEADEYDRNFLNFYPWMSLITTVSYDHPDTYPTWDDYVAAFAQFKLQSEMTVDMRTMDKSYADLFRLAGQARREDAQLAAGAIGAMMIMAQRLPDEEETVEIMNRFPGVGRRFERLGMTEGFYSDYAHHPEEIEATIDVALDECRLKGYKGVVAVYEPHQNVRQHEVRRGYRKAFRGVEKLYWLPTYLTREDSSLSVLTPADFIKDLKNAEVAEPAEANDKLLKELMKWRKKGYLILLMTAGPADRWLRDELWKVRNAERQRKYGKRKKPLDDPFADLEEIVD